MEDHSQQGQDQIDTSEDQKYYSEILSKLKKIDPKKLNVVLTLGGSFYPIHLNHLKTIECAQRQIQVMRPDINIIGLFLIPTQIECLAKKLNVKQKELRDIDIHRLKMCQIIVQDHPDIMIYSYLYNQSTNKGLAVATLRLQDTLNKYFRLCQMQKQDQIQAITVTGIDKFELLARKSKNGPIVFVENRPSQNISIHPQQIIEKNKLQKYQQNIIIIEDKENSQEMSSTLVRQLCNSGQDFSAYTGADLYNYHLQNNIKYVNANVLKEEKIEEKIVLDIPNLEDIIKFSYDSIKYEEITDLDFTQQLGFGVQASVHKATYKGRPVAVKVYSLEKEKSQKIKCFLRELRALILSRHPNVVHLYGVGQYKHLFYLVLELTSNQNVLDFICRNRKNWDQKPFNNEFIRALSELSLGLHQMSVSGILHRDIQTKNILISHSDQNFDYQNLTQLDKNCTLKICDFGLSAIEEDKDSIVRGSTRHYSPESMEDKRNYYPQSDVYMLGNSIWEMVYTKIIFTHSNVGEVHKTVISGEREEFDDKCPPEIQSVIEKCWKHNYLERPSFLEISNDLKQIYMQNLESEKHNQDIKQPIQLDDQPNQLNIQQSTN
ncbi:protein kinase (macronuclear) [Tetrahymena thermophila SB210]|uniref:Protein kinase n=1 Tax=Tetrahymena thermophila (strain SB210) TaxID=312017 RepID=Q22BY1_TETTS|nr:protein kinase [Tetrahymena thermophila SB210]EAR82777.1 protein kinase [Tetrahymena thermophila SB210]|eukprot:XP_001030440.1 protein kinase [Tetrahymena thermophila SB210]